MEQALLLEHALDHIDVSLLSAAEAKIGERLVVDGEEAHGGPILGRHVGDGRAVG